MPQSVPVWAQQVFSDDQRAKIEAKIADLEANTRGEVVVIVAERSSTVGHVPYSMFVSLLLLFTLADLPHVQTSLSGKLWWPILLWPLLAIILTRMFLSFPVVQRWFIPKADQLSQVETRAETEFYRYGLQKTDGSTGVLVFVSLFEHQAVILGDKTISEKLPADTWVKVLADLIGEAKAGNLPTGILKALDDIDPILRQNFPASGKNPNELPNHLVFVNA